jgi:osmotically-inducible protein OsmY
MHKTRNIMTLALAGLVLVGPAVAQRPEEPDNSRQNKTARPTADQQKENKADRDLAQEVRRSLSSDKSLSTYAHNVKVIVQDGTVTLNGPVRSEEEKAAVESKAKQIAGVSNVVNDLTVAPQKK